MAAASAIARRAPTAAPKTAPKVALTALDRRLALLIASGGDPRPTWLALARGEGGRRPCHLGQPVAVGPRWALRVCASMPMITDAAEQGFAAIEADLDEAFGSWAALRS